MARAKRTIERFGPIEYIPDPIAEAEVIAPAALAEVWASLHINGPNRKQGESDQDYAHRCSEEFVS